VCCYPGWLDPTPKLFFIPPMYVNTSHPIEQFYNSSPVCSLRGRCIFVRVVDTCQGCSKGSKHVDLTRTAFEQLASLNEGILSVQMRTATPPTQWWALSMCKDILLLKFFFAGLRNYGVQRKRSVIVNLYLSTPPARFVQVSLY